MVVERNPSEEKRDGILLLVYTMTLECWGLSEKSCPTLFSDIPAATLEVASLPP